MENGEIYQELKQIWRKRINLHWENFLDTRIIEGIFQLPSCFDRLKKIIWCDASVEYFNENERLTISFLLPGHDSPNLLIMEFYDNDYLMYLNVDGRYNSFSNVFKSLGKEKWIWRIFWEFDLTGYIYDFQKLVDNYKTK